VILDPDTVGETGDFLNPRKPPAGIDLVVVNGTPVWDGTSHSFARPGEVLRRS
jgi:N-acyl-D-amino-acid deacylase